MIEAGMKTKSVSIEKSTNDASFVKKTTPKPAKEPPKKRGLVGIFKGKVHILGNEEDVFNLSIP